MTIELSPEQERAIHEAIQEGFIRSVDDFIAIAIAMLPHSRPSESSRQAAVLAMEGFLPEGHLGFPSIGAHDFFVDRSIADLAESQKVRPIQDASVLAGGIPDDVDLDQFLGDVYASRK